MARRAASGRPYRSDADGPAGALKINGLETFVVFVCALNLFTMCTMYMIHVYSNGWAGIHGVVIENHVRVGWESRYV